MLNWLRGSRITLLAEKLEQNPLTFEQLIAWVPVATVWARVSKVRDRGTPATPDESASGLLRFVILRRADVDVTMRVRYRRHQYRIRRIEGDAAEEGSLSFVAQPVD